LAILGAMNLSGGLGRWLARPRSGISTVGYGRFVEFSQEGFARGGKARFETTPWTQHTGAAISAETFHDRIALLEKAHDFAKADCICGSCQSQATTCTTPGGNEASACEILHDLRQMIEGNVELVSDTGSGRRLVWIICEPHQSPQSKISESGETHLCS
jgi:hypothetical protein